MAGFDALGFAASRLVRHGAEREGDVPAPDTPDGLTVLIGADRIVVAGATALLERDRTAAAADRALTIHLGRLDGRPVFAATLTPEAALRYAEDPAFETIDLRTLASEGRVVPDELGLLATARSLLSWHARHGFCANCGAATAIAAAGFRRDCAACGTHHFPRTDPVVIMLVTRGDACLLGRGAHFLPGLYSCLAGFLEPGETIEDAVRRETFEEAGLRIGAVRYLASQPWPFPSSLMIGCVGESLSDTVAIDPAELEDARWFDRAEVAAMIARTHPEGLTVPPVMAIAHWLMRAFLDGRA